MSGLMGAKCMSGDRYDLMGSAEGSGGDDAATGQVF
jgi:hypothetical protein